jgi:hypothetical protein
VGVGGEGVGWGALGFGDYLDAGLPVAKSAPNPYTTHLLNSALKLVLSWHTSIRMEWAPSRRADVASKGQLGN